MQNSKFKSLLINTARKRIEKVQPLATTDFPGCLPFDEEAARRFRDIFNNDLERLIEDKYFLGLGKDVLWPTLRNDILDLFSERKKRPINFNILIEGIGAGKTRYAAIVTWLQWFELSTLCAEGPQRYYNIIDGSSIALIMMSRTEKQAKKITFSYVWDHFQSKFNQEYFPPNSRITSEIRIDRNDTVIFPGTATHLSALGYNCYGGTIDEANFLEVTVDSMKGGNVSSDTYDAAEEMFKSIWNRMVSRFSRNGTVRGMLNLISSVGYPDCFLERKASQAKDPVAGRNIFVKRRNAYDVNPHLDTGEGYFYFDAESYDILEDDDPRCLEYENARSYGKLNEFGCLDYESTSLRR